LSTRQKYASYGVAFAVSQLHPGNVDADHFISPDHIMRSPSLRFQQIVCVLIYCEKKHFVSLCRGRVSSM